MRDVWHLERERDLQERKVPLVSPTPDPAPTAAGPSGA